MRKFKCPKCNKKEELPEYVIKPNEPIKMKCICGNVYSVSINNKKNADGIKLNDGLYATNTAQKKKHFNKFAKLIEDQFKYGGKKYELLPNVESTDMLTLAWGEKGLMWTINKYLYRFANQHREKDLLKVATYCYILWLKHGFHLAEEHDTDTGKK